MNKIKLFIFIILISNIYSANSQIVNERERLIGESYYRWDDNKGLLLSDSTIYFYNNQNNIVIDPYKTYLKKSFDSIEAFIAKPTYEYIEDKAGSVPIVRAMSEIAGSAVMLIAAEYLSSKNGKGIILGGITGVPPTKVVILGAGTVAEYATRTALGLGAEVKVFDNHVYKLRRLKNTLGNQLYTSTIDSVTLLNELKRDFNFTCIFISHDLSVVKFMSDRMIVMNRGKIEEIGDADEIYISPKSPVTQKLIAAIPAQNPEQIFKQIKR